MRKKFIYLRLLSIGHKLLLNLTVALSLLIVGVNQTNAQSMRILKFDETETTYRLANLNSLVFTKRDMTIKETGQTPVTVGVNEIRYLSCLNLTNIFSASNKLQGKIRVYPNPVENELYIELTENSSFKGRIEVISMNGTILHVEQTNEQSSSYKIDVSRLSQGIYFCKVHFGDDVQIVKFHKV